VGVANYGELAKGQMLGGMDGFLKIIFSPDDFKILGVHAIGEGATEIVHIGQVRFSSSLLAPASSSTARNMGSPLHQPPPIHAVCAPGFLSRKRGWLGSPGNFHRLFHCYASMLCFLLQVAMTAGGTIKYFVDAVFNYPTLAEAYNIAAQNGLRNVGIYV
jgi:pyruvate/2-oxoglutarate dehydrogenase complex dihydrolipoamide dehydrogenase (E3) component